ncbi:hypothetical protein NEOKW01_1545 [Nematocida sp. AWRm80]|nr:hypothetical protein NEOKW01_1545 [Nematocida sp. AWRm80]
MRREQREERKEEGVGVGQLVGEGICEEVLSRIVTKDTLFYCQECKEAMLQPQTYIHVCTKNPILEESEFYDSHCGVIDPETQQRCGRSLNCKAHSILMKRAIPKRSAPFDVLLKKSMEEKKKKRRKIEKNEEKTEIREKASDTYSKLEAHVLGKILHRQPVIEKTFYLPEIKFDTLAIRSIFFHPLKVYRMMQERKNQRKTAN